MSEPDISNMRGGFLYSEEYSPERKGNGFMGAKVLMGCVRRRE
jgi:hypothetical protein